MKKQIITVLVAVFLCLNFSLASGIDTPIDGGGGGYSGPVGGYYWADLEGIRVSIYDKLGNRKGHIVDYSNSDVSSKVVWFYTKKTKVDYLSGAPLALDRSGGRYISIIPTFPLPDIINKDMSGAGNSTARIALVKNYFRDTSNLRTVFDNANVSYTYNEELAKIDKKRAEDQFILSVAKYKLVIEPIAYFVYANEYWAMTATEASLFPDPNSTLKNYLGALTRLNLPLSVYSTKDFEELGIKTYTGGSGRQDNATILRYLGAGVITFSGSNISPPKPKPINADYDYRCDKEVITAFDYEAEEDKSPDNPLNITFKFEGAGIDEINLSNILCPEGEKQRVWVKWKTPKEPAIVKIEVVDEEDYVFGYLSAKIEKDQEISPPDPKPHDRNDAFISSYNPSKNPFTESEDRYKDWYVWEAKSDDEGNWEFEKKEYEARLHSSGKIFPARLTPTSYGKTMKSGYGFEAKISANISTNDSQNVTGAGSCKMYFPEFYYSSYNRILDTRYSDFIFKKNKYSQEYYLASNDKSRVHFTPLWYPDMPYRIKAMIYDVWTPSGEMRAYFEDTINISGNMYQDWHIGPLK